MFEQGFWSVVDLVYLNVVDVDVVVSAAGFDLVGVDVDVVDVVAVVASSDLVGVDIDSRSSQV